MQVDFDMWRRTARAGIGLSVLPVVALAVVEKVERASQYEATLRGLALEECACVTPHRGNGMSCLSCAACRILSRADARVNDNVPL